MGSDIFGHPEGYPLKENVFYQDNQSMITSFEKNGRMSCGPTLETRNLGIGIFCGKCLAASIMVRSTKHFPNPVFCLSLGNLQYFPAFQKVILLCVLKMFNKILTASLLLTNFLKLS